MSLRRFWWVLNRLVAGGLVLAGCAGARPAVVVQGNLPATAGALPTDTPLTATAIPLVPLAAAGQTATPQLAPPASPMAPPADKPAFHLCSPLALHPLSELPEIISDPYRPPPPGKEARHHGVDFAYYRRGERLSILGVEVQSVLPGRVAAALTDSFPYGNMVIVETPGAGLPEALAGRVGIAAGESLYVLYAHLGNAPLANLDDPVEACQLLGAVGKSGNAGVAHLHLETRLGPPGRSFPALQFYLAQVTAEERENYLLWRTSGVFRHFDPMQLLSQPGE